MEHSGQDELVFDWPETADDRIVFAEFPCPEGRAGVAIETVESIPELLPLAVG
jgi:hypothetical protein